MALDEAAVGGRFLGLRWAPLMRMAGCRSGSGIESPIHRVCCCSLSVLFALVVVPANAAVVIDPANSGATDVLLGPYPPITQLANPLSDPFNALGSGQVLVVGNTAAGALGVTGGGQVSVK